MLLLASMAGNAQERKYSTFYYQRATLFACDFKRYHFSG